MKMNDGSASPRSYEEWLRELNAPGISLEEARKIQIPHGPLRRVEWSYDRRGMAVNDCEKTQFILTMGDGGDTLLWRKTKGSMQRTVTEREYRVGGETADAVLSLVERENLIGWSKMKVDPDRIMFAPDMSWSSSVSLTFLMPEGDGERKVTISPEAAEQQGGDKVISALIDLLKECVRDDALLSEKTETADPAPSPFLIPMGLSPQSGPWVCPGCGSRGNTGKFCPECGRKRPV